MDWKHIMCSIVGLYIWCCIRGCFWLLVYLSVTALVQIQSLISVEVQSECNMLVYHFVAFFVCVHRESLSHVVAYTYLFQCLQKYHVSRPAYTYS